jgi:hypothetical protein
MKTMILASNTTQMAIQNYQLAFIDVAAST